jgi:hypothetical protein
MDDFVTVGKGHNKIWVSTDVLGVVQNVSGMLSIRRKVNNDELPKRDITIADER